MCTTRLMSANAGRCRLPTARASGPLGLNGAPGKRPKPVMSTVTMSYPERMRDFLDRERGRERALGHRLLDRRQARPELGVGLQPQVKAVFQHRPHPFDLLLAAARRKFADCFKLLAMRQRLVPKVRNPIAG